MDKKKTSLLSDFALIFGIFALIIIIISGYSVYELQKKDYKRQCEDRLRNVTHYLAHLIENEGNEFIIIKDYVIENREELYLPINYDLNYHKYKDKADKLLAEKYPGKILGKDLAYEDLDKETMDAVAIYKYVYWTNTFWTAAKDFSLEYTYFLCVSDQKDHMYYVIDAAPTPCEDDETRLKFCDDVFEDPEKHAVMWKTWNTGCEQDVFDVFHNAYGDNYGFYTPLYLDGHKIGLIAADISIEAVNNKILQNTILQILVITFVIGVVFVILIHLINRGTIFRIRNLQKHLEIYSHSKDPAVAGMIRENMKKNDEIAALETQAAKMIDSLDEHMIALSQTIKALDESKQNEKILSALSEKDALTGIRNKMAYDNEVKKIEWKMAKEDFTKFGIAMIDLNFLKLINDTFGHDKGNISIKRICDIICHAFTHSPVFRVGGDEFVVIFENEDYENAAKLVKEFKEKLQKLEENESLEPWEKVSAAIGWTLYDPKIDISVANVFKRADRLMYQDKKEIKSKMDLHLEDG